MAIPKSELLMLQVIRRFGTITSNRVHHSLKLRKNCSLSSADSLAKTNIPIFITSNPNTTNMSTKRNETNGSDEENGAQPNKTYATRKRVESEQEKHVRENIDHITSLNLAKKRKLYKCKESYVKLSEVPTWSEHFRDVLTGSSINDSWWMRNKSKVVADIKPDLNEKISVFCGDITTLEIDAIVNAANESLLGGGGVDGAIHRAAGRNLLMECELLHGCQAGEAKITCGYNLPAKHVIHTVGPRGEYPETLHNCYQNSLDLVKENGLKSVAFPCISTGIFGYPNGNAAKVALKTIRDWMDKEDYTEQIERIIFCLFLKKDVDIYNEQLQLFFPLDKDSSTSKSKGAEDED